MSVSLSRLLRALVVVTVFATASLHATLTVTPVTWNVAGLDSNSPATGPHLFPVGARVCSNVATTNVAVNFLWDSPNPNVNLRAGSLSTINLASIGAGNCADAYFEVDVTQTPAAYDTTRRYHITATDGSGTFSTVTPREIYVEHLISQNRNSITDVKFGPNVGSLTSVPPGGSMALTVGNTYVIQLLGGTATQGYNQFEAFINLPTTIFQILSVNTSYSADNSPYVPNPNDKLYADACLWQSDPNAPTYRSCIGGDFKAGGSNVVTTYTIKVLSGGGTNQTLNTLLYDFSGSSYHYNADYTTGARIASIIDPTSATISKSFSPNPASLNGISALTITLTNPNGATLAGYNFVDNLPANLVIATPSGATTSGCGTPTLTALAGGNSITFSNGTLAANSNCVIKLNVTPTATGTLVNTTNHLFIDTTDTTHSATASLTVNNAPPPGTGLCGVTFVKWTVPNGTTANPPDTTGGVPTIKAANVVTATAVAGVPASSAIDTANGHGDTTSWKTFGYKNAGQTMTFTVDTTNYTGVHFNFWLANIGAANGPTQFTVSVNSGAGFGAPVLTVNSPAAAFTNYDVDLTGLTNVSGNTLVKIAATGANNDNNSAGVNIDDVAFTGCTSAVKATIAKAFAPNPIAVNAVSTLTFTLTNTNTAALTGAAFTDALPAGVQVAATPAASTTCAGATWAPAAGNTTLTFSGGTIPASGSCTVSVNVTATTAGPHANTTSPLATTEGGTNTTSLGTATLTAIVPPSIAKEFSPSPIIPGGTSTLTFTITNLNQNDAISGVAFNDTFPVAPGAMVVAGTPAPTTSGCGAPAFAPAAGAGSISFTGGSIAAGGTCIVTVKVTAPVAGTYNNTSGNVSHIVNGTPVNGNTASGALTVNPPNPSIHLLKQVGTSPTGPWLPYVSVPVGANIYYQFTVENTGDVPLLSPNLTDNQVNVSSCNAGWSGVTLPVAVAGNDNHIVTCVVGPVSAVSGSHQNTAHASATFSGNPVNSPNSSAIYATTGITLAKSVTETSFTNAGDQLHYSYLVTNSGFATLNGPVTVADDKATVTCPALTTIGDLDNFFDPGEQITCTATYTIVLADVSAAQVTNHAQATVDGVNSNTDSRTVPLSTAADVELVKTLDTAGPFTAGQTVSYTITVFNHGPSTATNIQVTDTPTNLTITNVTGSGCSLPFPCTIASLANGANTAITVTATINAAGAFDNSATATGAQPDPNPGNNTDNVGNGGTAAASADVQLDKTLVTAGPFVAGQTISYTITVTNHGPSTATSIQVTDTPTNLSITGVTGACAALPCTIASLANGANAVINVTAKITAAGAFDNSATATAVESDPNLTNNTDSSGNNGTAAASADVQLDKTLVTAGPFYAGQTISYTITITNNGPSTATNILVTDTPTNLSITGVTGACATLPCTIGSLANGANAVINVTAKITAAGAFDNSATATGTENDPNTGNNTDSSGNNGSATLLVDVSMDKSLDTQGPFIPGQTISYTLVVANAGPSTATNIQVTDTPTNLSITGVTGACAALPCTIASLASGANATINVTATINAGGAFDNSATATPAETDSNTGNNTDNTGNNGTATAMADVAIDKTLVTAGPFVAGQSISYTLTVTNNGPSVATSIQVTDTPTNLNITNVSGSCVALPCTIPSLANGANAIINVTATIVAAGAFDNSATATPAETDPNLANNTDNSGNNGTAAPSVDVSIVKTLTTAGPYNAGQTVTYSLLVANAGPSTATNIQVTDTPTNVTITNVTGSGCSNPFPCTIASLAAGANTTITVTATINSSGTFSNTTTATPAENDSDTSNNSSTATSATGVAADVAVDKTLVTAPPFMPGQTISYTIVVTNNGPSTATNIQVTDTPTNLSITGVSGACAALPCTIASLASGANTTINVTATITSAGAFDNSASANATEFDPNSGNNTDNTGNGGTAVAADVSMTKTLLTAPPFTAGQTISYSLVVANAGPSTATNIAVTDTPTNLSITGVTGACASLPCTIASLASGANATINVTATITAPGAFDNSATASGKEPDPNPGNNTDSVGNGGSTSSADVALAKTLVTAPPFTPGQTISYTIVVTNNGPSTATSIQVTDTPTNLSGFVVTGACSALPCTIPSLASGANATINVTATITAAGAFDNSATALAVESDPNLANNTDNTGNGGVTGVTTADVMITKTASAPTVVIGGTLDYTMVVHNNGPSTATNVTVTDPLPASFALISANPSQGSCSGTTTVTCTLGTLGNGATATITLHGTVTTAGSLANTATVTATEADSVPSNNSSTATPLAVDDIPTVSTYGLMLLAIALGITGAFVMKNAGRA